jgi:ABC-2 type transport system ATP-binding protein
LEIKLSNVTKHFGSTLAVDNVSIQLSGQINLLLGSNGSGKSTLINLLAGLAYPNAGKLRIDGSEYEGKNRRDWRKGTERLRKKSRFWLDKPGLPLPLTGKELLNFESRNEKKVRTSLSGIENLFGPTIDLNKPISSYSSGMQQKLGIMATLIGNPEFVVWDEPTAALDATSRTVVANIAKEYASRGTKFLIATHIPGDFEGVADWIGLMKLGQLVKSGKVSDLSNDESSNDYIIVTDKAREVASKLLELGLAQSVSIDEKDNTAEPSEKKTNSQVLAVKATQKLDESKIAQLAKEELGAKELAIRKRQKSITELYLEAIA